VIGTVVGHYKSLDRLGQAKVVDFELDARADIFSFGIWKDADISLPVLAAARKESAALGQ
jgi:hypothetical protein